MAKRYASLVGPLLGVYFPLPTELTNRVAEGVALNTSKLQRLWCSVYDEKEVDRMIKQFGGKKLPDHPFASQLDYDSHEVERALA